MTTGSTTEPITSTSTAQMTRSLLRTIYRERLLVWIVFAVFMFAISLLVGLFYYPQSYSAMDSISLSQASGGGGSQLALLAGVGGGNKAKYIGPLKSRKFAEQVEKTAHLRDLYDLPSNDDAVEKLQRNVRFDDNATDGLLYITMTLDAPPRLAPNSEARRAKIRNATAVVTNAYAAALKNYIVFNDTDKDLQLLKSADIQLRQARTSYEAAVEKWISFVRGSKSPTMSAGSTSGSGQSPELAQLQSLFVRRGTLEAQIRSTEAALEATNHILSASPSALAQIPTEDLLLTEARRRYTEAHSDLQNLLIQQADDSPPVRRAREHLKIAALHLREQAEAILNGNTSEHAKREALKVEYETVLEQIAIAERSIKISKDAATGFEKLHAEVELSLKILEATATRFAELKLQTVSAQSRMNVVDEARPPLKSRPGMLMTSLVSLFVALGSVLAWYAVEYTARSARLSAKRGGRPLESHRIEGNP